MLRVSCYHAGAVWIVRDVFHPIIKVRSFSSPCHVNVVVIIIFLGELFCCYVGVLGDVTAKDEQGDEALGTARLGRFRCSIYFHRLHV